MEASKEEMIKAWSIIVDWANSLPRLGYLHAVDIPLSDDKIKSAINTCATIYLLHALCNNDGSPFYREKEGICSFAKFHAIGEILPIADMTLIYDDFLQRSERFIVNDFHVKGLRAYVKDVSDSVCWTSNPMQAIVPIVKAKCWLYKLDDNRKVPEGA